MSAKQRRDPCSGPLRTQRITGSEFPISLQPDWPIEQQLFLTAESWRVLQWVGAQNKDFGAGLQTDFTRGLVSSVVKTILVKFMSTFVICLVL